MNVLHRLLPPPRFLAMPAAGIDISDAFVRAISFSGSLGSLHVDWWAEEPLPKGAVVGGAISRREQLVSVLKKIQSARSIRFVRAALSEQQAYVFETEAPTALAEAHTAIGLHLEEQVPIRSNDSVFAIEPILHRRNNTALSRYVAVAAPRAASESYASAFRDAGLSLLSLESEAETVARAVSPAKNDRPILVINLSEDDAGLFIVCGRLARFSTTIPLTAEETARDPGALAREAARVCAFWEGEHGNVDGAPRSAVACGAGAGDARTLASLASVLHMPVEPALVWRHALSVEHAAPALPQRDALRFASAIGLALGSFSYA